LVVQRARHQLFAGAALTGDEHRRVGAAHAGDQLEDVAHGRELPTIPPKALRHLQPLFQ
jgi:hypothetical protein